MTRVMKAHNERRNEIIQTAQKLFFSQGYEQTPVNAIIDAVGISKGTFYHYFTSKEDLLDQMVAVQTEAVLERARPALQLEGVSPTEKLNRAIQDSTSYKMENLDAFMLIARLLARPENLVLRHKMSQRNSTVVAELFREVIEDGVKSGEMKPRSPQAAAEFIMLVGQAIGEEVFHMIYRIEQGERVDVEKLRPLYMMYQDAVECILATPEGAVNIFDEAAIGGLIEAIQNLA
jgi:AcrR family transcriptional regulator